jgi:integrase
MLDSLDRETALILTTKSKQPWKARYFKAHWSAAANAAGIKDLHFHDLRGTAVTMLAEAGCTTPQIASIAGHSLKTVAAILEKYLSRTSALAEEAVTLFENARSTDFANRLTALKRSP